jgi:hypothetical protein
MATVSELRDDRHEIAGVFERLLEDLMGDAVGELDRLMHDEGGNSTEAAVATVVALFSDIREEYFESYEDIAEPIIQQIQQQGLWVDPDNEILDLLDFIKEDHVELLDNMERDWTERIRNISQAVQIPGVNTEDLMDYIERTRSEYSNEIIGNTDIFHRVMSDLFTGGMIVFLGELILNTGTSNWRYTYVGPKDHRNRPHCSNYVGATLTRRDINRISPSQLMLAGNDPAVTPAYITTPCRHNWELASKG